MPEEQQGLEEGEVPQVSPSETSGSASPPTRGGGRRGARGTTEDASRILDALREHTPQEIIKLAKDRAKLGAQTAPELPTESPTITGGTPEPEVSPLTPEEAERIMKENLDDLPALKREDDPRWKAIYDTKPPDPPVFISDIIGRIWN